MSNPKPQPATPGEVKLTIERMGGLCQQRALCPPSRWHEDTSEDGPLISDDVWVWMMSDDDDEPISECEAWLSRRGL